MGLCHLQIIIQYSVIYIIHNAPTSSNLWLYVIASFPNIVPLQCQTSVKDFWYRKELQPCLQFIKAYSWYEIHWDLWVTASSLSCSQVEGSELKKIRPSTRVYQRYYLLDAGLQALYWEPSKKESDKARIFLDSIREVSVNKKTSLKPPTDGFLLCLMKDLRVLWSSL